MWPKILIELIPHISRLVPMADKFFASRGATDEATQQSIAALRSDLAQTATTHAAIYRQLNDQSNVIAEAAADARATRALMEAMDARIATLEALQRKQMVYLALMALVVIIGFLATPILLWSHSH